MRLYKWEALCDIHLLVEIYKERIVLRNGSVVSWGPLKHLDNSIAYHSSRHTRKQTLGLQATVTMMKLVMRKSKRKLWIEKY